MVIMAQARKNRKQWRPKAIIQSAAAHHRTNADNIISSYYQEKQSIASPASIVPDKTSVTLPVDTTETIPMNNKAFRTQRNSLMLTLSTTVLTPACYPSMHQASSSCEQNDDEEERDDIVLFIQHEQINGDNQIEILSSNNEKNDTTNDIPFKTKNCSSQTDHEHHCHNPAKRAKTRLKTKPNSDSTAITTAVNTATNNVKTAKRKAYSRMKKERKATQTLIIVLSKLK
jgi:hypothetical protein